MWLGGRDGHNDTLVHRSCDGGGLGEVPNAAQGRRDPG